MKTKHNRLTEHYLVPAVLVTLNVGLAHVIYAFVIASTYSPAGKIALATAFVLMGGSLLIKKQALLMGSILLYIIIALWV